jgi:uncharacterized membrane protein YdjX (TVP38/TMEM64 family)
LKHKQAFVKKLIFVIVIIVLLIWINRTFLHISPLMITEWMLSWGWLAPFVFLILFTVRPFVVFPSSILAITSGLTFGFWYGLLLTFIGSNLGSIATWIVVRSVGSKIVKSKWDDKYYFIKKQIDQKGFIYMLILRLLPVMNFDIVSYAASFSSVKFRHYVLATLIGVVPGAVIYTSIGSSVQSEKESMIILSITLLVILLLIPLLFRRQIKQWLSLPKH